MTTINNYLSGNFANKDVNQIQRPICLIKSNNHKVLRSVWKYTTHKNMSLNRNIIIIDFGIRWNKILSEMQNLKFQQKFNHKIYHLKANQLLIKPVILQLKNNQIFSHLLQLLQSLVKTQNLKNILILIQGIQTLQVFTDQKSIEQFFMKITSLSIQYKQINICMSKGVDKRIEYLIEKMSTCLIQIKQKIQDNIWNITSFVRRYTGFSNQQNYSIQIKDQFNIKVEKRKQKKDEVKDQIKDLGFQFKKNQTQKQQQNQIKKIIYPYLNVQQNNCDDCQCSTKQNENKLISLDEQQEEEDDVDV